MEKFPIVSKSGNRYLAKVTTQKLYIFDDYYTKVELFEKDKFLFFTVNSKVHEENFVGNNKPFSIEEIFNYSMLVEIAVEKYEQSVQASLDWEEKLCRLSADATKKFEEWNGRIE